MRCSICCKDMRYVGALSYRQFVRAHINAAIYEQEVFVCEQCGIIGTPPPCLELLSYLYSEGDDYSNYSSLSPEKENYVQRAVKAKAMIQALGMEFDSILDIGASTGYFLSLFKDECEVYGIETSKAGVVTAKKRYDLDLWNGYADDFFSTSARKYELITMLHVLEHIVNPMGFLNQVHEHNSRYVYVEVPSLEGTYVVEPYGFFSQEHINYFTANSLENLFNRAGYECMHLDIDHMVRFRVQNGFPMIRAVFEKVDNPTKCIHPGMESEAEMIKRYLEKSEDETIRVRSLLRSQIKREDRVAIWGASFQTERLLCFDMEELFDCVECILDNSPQKQKLHMELNGRYIPVLKPTPEVIKGVDKVIISSYNNQEAMLRVMADYGEENKAVFLY